ncbi:ANTAR domain-containing response regulator [Lichenicoccus roseus]|uniref:ANTAR domain-containing protein n=1 Tax=Lichenicoccus roseus TaxID=2683649 RepID=A0A5R9J4X8_9PROT|nr:ANTAR domain-containing protein [Lichenicoccus roseus]TLU72612.1 ANTAR domain-containing protein [Lichenicoccus roseus]
MSRLRLIQNFSGLRAMLFRPTPDSASDPLQHGLARLGVTVEHAPEQPDALAELSLCADRDVLIVDGDPGACAILPLLIELKPPVPVIGLIGMETPSRLRLLMEAGATAMLRKPVQSGALYTSLYLGINGYRQRQLAEARIAEHERRRRGRRGLVKAILHVMQRDGLDDDTAFETLRRDAMRARLGIEDYCDNLMQTLPRQCAPARAPFKQERDHG